MKLRKRRIQTAAALLSVATLMAGCGSDDAKVSDAKRGQLAVGSVTDKEISADRCAENAKAGEITYLTGYDFAASAGIIDAVVADQLGYFKRMCLNVKVQSGFDTANIPLVSAGKAQFTALGSISEIADANQKGGNVEAIGVLGHRPIEALAVSGKANIAKVENVANTTMGVQGTIPFSVRVMLVNAGVSLDSIKQVDAGFNPLALDQGTFASRPVYKSSEPRQLDAAKVNYKLFDPADSGVVGSFGVITGNKDFVTAYPTATQDFLRAQLQGLHYALTNPDQAVDLTYKRSDPKYYLSGDTEKFRWNVESALVKESTPAGRYYGFVDADEIRKEVDPLVTKLKSLPSMPDVSQIVDTSFGEAIHKGGKVVWPDDGTVPVSASNG